jgi:hypothetical protein
MGCLMPPTRPVTLHDVTAFELRRALERLREGLFDPLAVRLLTAHRQELDARLQQDWQRLERDEAVHLCVCGAYGQGKSHTLAYIEQHALQQGYAVSAINLDPREVPWHLFRQVYRALMLALRLPASDDGSAAASETLIRAWSAWARQQTLSADDQSASLAALLPDDMPHIFKAILVALAQSTVPIPPQCRRARRHRQYRPAVFPWTLRRALDGETVPVAQLRAALKYRQVSFYLQGSLALGSDEPFLGMLLTLPQLFRRLGYRGWVVLFDEAEAMAQVRRPTRARSYRLLHRLLFSDSPRPGLYPVFAFTPDFFQRVQEEDFDQPPFDRDYARAWRHLAVYDLRGLSEAEWQGICQQLIVLHGAAYDWPADPEQLGPRLSARLRTMRAPEPRFVLKALVDELDQEQQQHFFARRFGPAP